MKKKLKRLPQKPDLAEKRFHFRLLSVDVIENYINDEYTAEQLKGSKQLRYSNGMKFELNPKNNTIQIEVVFNLYLDEEINKVQLINFRSTSTYLTIDLVDHLEKVGKDDHVLTKEVERRLGETSFSHARGIHAYLIKDKGLNGFFIPFGEISGFKQTPISKKSD